MVNWRALSLRATGGEGPYDVVTLALTVAALALLYAACRRSRVDGPDSGAIWALAMLAGILAAPHVYLQSLILLAPAALWAAGLVRQARAWRHLEALAVAAVGVSWWANVDHAVGLPALQILLTAIFFAAAGRLVLTGSRRQAAPARSPG